MSVVVPLFLIAPLVLVPLGYRLLEVAAPGSRPPAVVLRAVVPAAGLLVVSFWLPAGPVAAALALPWVAVTGLTALLAGLRLLHDPDRFRPSVRHATDAAVAFLAVGATFALTDRLGARPFDFPSTIILLTAVHFHYAGFVLPLAGALAYGRRPSRWLEVALGAVVIGIPITALGFLGLPFANWVGAMLTAIGGLGIGLATILVARTFVRRSAVALALFAGASLLISMPMAIAYATETLFGTAWLDVDTMARVHGGLNALGFALPVVLAWTLQRLTNERDIGPAPAVIASPRRRWMIGVTTGFVVGVGVLVGGAFVAMIGIAAIVLLAIEPGRDAPVGGLLSGFGGAWIVLFVRADLSCRVDCIEPDLTAWYVVSAALLLIGVALTARAFRRVQAHPASAGTLR